MNKKMSKRQRDIKSKLMAAICMLLVSSIMMVSSTYAWFTLSTAPEVTGIQTAVGANGNLEMALMPLHGDVTKITSGTSDSMASSPVQEANITWGNLVDLGTNHTDGDNLYGMNKITLYPAELNLQGDGKINTTIPLKTPVYGSDGRVSELATSTTTGVYVRSTDGSGFYQSTTDENNQVTDAPTGVRAIGTVSGMTQAQKDYREALSSASNAAANARGVAAGALKSEGPALAAIAIEHATSSSESYTKEDLQALVNMLDALVGENGSLSMIDDAIRYYLYAAEITKNEAGYAALKADFYGENEKSWAELESYYSDTDMEVMIGKLDTTLTNANAARTALVGLIQQNKDSYAWNDFADHLNSLANPENMEVNDIPVGELNDPVLDENDEPKKDAQGNTITNMSALVSSAMSKGLNLTLASGSGVYADVADFCGNFSATINIDIVYNGTAFPGVPASMNTATAISPSYLSQAESYVRNTVGAPAGGNSASMPITDYYGYIIDLAFRTNAADSHLRLQTEGVDRIYDGNTQNEETLGGGSTMTFKSQNTEQFPNAKVLQLMEHVKVVFFNPADGSILAYGKLDGVETTETDGSITKGMILVDAEGVAIENNDLMELEQNNEHQVSVLVYLDGTQVTNADVAYSGTTSMTGKLNLQFASSADLVPMEYSDLRTGANNGTSSTPAAPTVTDVTATVNDGYTATVKHVVSGENAYLVAAITDTAGEVTNGTVTINGTAASYQTIGTLSGWVISADSTAPSSATVNVA